MSSDDLNASQSNPRLEVIDALRGAALFGVLFVNMLWFAGFENALNGAQTARLLTAFPDRAVEYFMDIFVFAKAIGIFTFLFGFGFWMQYEALERRNPDKAAAVRFRRMFGLLAIGLVHWVLWSGEILHVYAVAGFVLMLVVRWRMKTLLIVGLLLAVFSRPVLGRLLEALSALAYTTAAASDELLAQRLEIFLGDSFLDVIRLQLVQDVWPQIVSGFWVAAAGHALGRFMIGAVVSKGRYLQSIDRYRPWLWGMVAISFPLGWIAQKDWLLTEALERYGWVTSEKGLGMLAHAWNSIGVTAMTAAYIGIFVLVWELELPRRCMRLLVPAGRMALTNYLIQTPINYLIFFGFGLGLMGRLGMAACLIISAAIFVVQILVSRLWLERYSMGPMEWLWRWWTYGLRPPLRRAIPQ